MKPLTRLIPLVAAATIAVLAGTATPASAELHQDPIGSCYGRTFGPGDATTCVKLVQGAINHAIGSHLVLDGYYGTWTTIGVMVWQSRNDLPTTGRIASGDNQWVRLCVELNPGSVPYWFAGCRSVGF